MPLIAQAVRLYSSHVLIVWATHGYSRLHDFDMIWRDIHTETHVLPSVRHLRPIPTRATYIRLTGVRHFLSGDSVGSQILNMFNTDRRLTL